MIFLQKSHDVTSTITVECFCALCGETASDNTICDVGHIEIEVVNLEPGLVG